MQSTIQPEQKMKSKNMTTLHLGNSISRSPLRRGCLLIALALACFGLSPIAQAVTPAPDGGYGGNNTAEGTQALFSLTTGANNTALGGAALFHNTSASGNTATGFRALFFNTTGISNTANGSQALYYNTTGYANTATGLRALFENTTGIYNTAHGDSALYSNTTGAEDTADGAFALFHNTTGSNNTANGDTALLGNTTGSDNTANGAQALLRNTTGEGNTANGVAALAINTTGGGNTANGTNALYSNTIGNNNTVNGGSALFSNTTGGDNTADGSGALSFNTTGSANIALGDNAGLNLTTGNNNIDIGALGVAGESNKIRIGTVGTQQATFIAGISGVTVAGGVGVIVDSNGQLGTVVSSERFKDEIKPMDKASEAILALKPVTFHYKKELDPEGVPQFGLVAEQVEKVNPDLVARDAQGEIYTVRYEAVNAMLLNEFLKEHRTVQELKSTAAKQEATITQLKSTVAQQQKDFQAAAAHEQEQIGALTADLQKVSAQVEMSRPAPQMAGNSR
jgi:uncharacterized coiled-coil protein SlyX